MLYILRMSWKDPIPGSTWKYRKKFRIYRISEITKMYIRTYLQKSSRKILKELTEGHHQELQS